MIYLYDDAIVNDLQSSFNDDIDNPVVKIISPDQIIGVAAQIHDDNIHFPLISLERLDSSIDNQLSNFARMHRGYPAVFEDKSHNIWNERAVPINLSYVLSVFTTNQYDMDEILRELIFKYLSMYFLKIRIPYEIKREISFGVVIDSDYGIQNKSGSSEYTESGQLYQSSITLRCEGCVLIHYTPRHLKRNVARIDVK